MKDNFNKEHVIDGDLCHKILVNKNNGKLRYDNNAPNYLAWKKSIKEKLIELLGLDIIAQNSCKLKLTIESDVKKEFYRQIRFVFESEIGAFVPCYLLVPNTNKKKYPLAITLQGHSTGFHNSIGEPKYERDFEYVKRGDFGVQAVKNGYAALCVEQRAMGERKTMAHDDSRMCTFPTLVAFMLGRTTIGERIWDIMRVIDLLPEFDFIDTEKILITGNSGGGTMSYYAACIDERIKISVPSCSFCSYEDSILSLFHCPCNYIPNSYNWFDMQDLSCLIAPRNLLVVAGELDEIFPIKGVRKAMDTVKEIYKKENALDNCSLIETKKGHWWCQDIIWPAINNITHKLGWFN